MKYRAIGKAIADSARPRNSIASGAWMPPDSSMPECAECGAQMQLFLQFDIRRNFELPFEDGSHVVLFMCPTCNEIPNFRQFGGGILPDQFWLKNEGHFFAAKYKPNASNAYVELPSVLQSYVIEYLADSVADPRAKRITLGGTPAWVQDPELYTCSCGATMGFIGQISENYPFPKLPGAPEQPDSFSADDYCLFLGNEIYIFACSQHCDDRAVWIVVQN